MMGYVLTYLAVSIIVGFGFGKFVKAGEDRK